MVFLSDSGYYRGMKTIALQIAAFAFTVIFLAYLIHNGMFN